ncbi:hypothetical protein MRS44_011783 [Fusarium solani]|uniref:uncharacterized protein n=1 Tax=Fusarium solani TaxID=169388 RepID=UPI0032C42758|nr:hypothetical protein MRS44_011783 [Fusarium solani]
MWYKPRRALAGPGEVPIPPIAANGFLDYEGELCIVLSRDARDVKVEEAPDYILGYTIGNDLTARFYQDPKRGGGQFTRCKAYDGFAPLGPILTNAKTFGGVGDKKITTKVNGTVFQNSLCDLIHGPETLVSFLSQVQEALRRFSQISRHRRVETHCYFSSQLKSVMQVALAGSVAHDRRLPESAMISPEW